MVGDCPNAVSKTDAAPRVASALAVVEVTLVTLLTLLAYKALKTIEPPGFNCSPGFTMLLVATVMLFVHRRDFASYGVVSDRWRYGLNVGVAFSVILLLGGLVEVAMFQTASHTTLTMPAYVAVGIACFRIPLYVLVLVLFSRARWKSSIERVPAACSILVLVGLLVAALAVAIHRGAPAWQAVGLAASLLLFTALGEELFFRGYVQSRLNIAFARPWRLLGIAIPPGLLLSSPLFGMIHVFNPTRPFDGHFELSWLWGASCVLSGLFFGYLREMTGSIWAGTIVHGLEGVYRGVAQVFLIR